MTTFGDDDPEDGWDAHDPPAQLLHLLLRWVQSIADEMAGPYDRVRMLARWTAARHACEVLRRRHASPVTLDQVLHQLDVIAATLQP